MGRDSRVSTMRNSTQSRLPPRLRGRLRPSLSRPSLSKVPPCYTQTPSLEPPHGAPPPSLPRADRGRPYDPTMSAGVLGYKNRMKAPAGVRVAVASVAGLVVGVITCLFTLWEAAVLIGW